MLFSSFKSFVGGAIVLFLLTCAGLPAIAQTTENSKKTSSVSGIVVDEKDEPMPGVAVYDKNALSSGTMTSDDGRFSLTISADCRELTFSCLGYKTLTLAPKDAARVRMEPDAESIQETVVTGIYTRKADSFTGAVQTITGDDLKRTGNQNVFQSLKNIDPSLMIIENLTDGSNPNAMPTMQLRGASSFLSDTGTNLKSNFVNDANMPLFVLDGFETSVEKIQDMDMNRIQSITILKDASAKAIYGSKAGNGVIVIETIALRAEEARVTYTGSLSLEIPDLSSYNLCNALEKLEVERREGYYENMYSTLPSSALVESSENLYNSRMKRALEGESTYWLAKPLRTGISNQHSLGVELGSKELKALATFNYNNIQGAMRGSYRETISGDINLAYRKEKWTFRNIMSIASMDNEESPYGSFSDYASLNPYARPYDDSGNLVKIVETVGGKTIGNPLYDATLNTEFSSKYLDFTDNMYIEYQMFDLLKLVGRFGIDTKKTESADFYPADHTKFELDESSASDDEKLRRGSFTASNGSYTSLSGDVSAQFNKSFGKDHDIFATAQYSISQIKYSEVVHYAEGFPNSRMNNITYARQYALDATPTGTDGINRNLGFLLTSGYSFKNRYMLDATVKTSASSVFGTNRKWGTFWSVGLAWNLHNEEWLKNVSWINQLKLRGSLGSSGNQNYMTNNSLPVYDYYNSKYYNGFSGAVLANMENPQLGWEERMDYNIGVDFRTKALTVNLDCYIADTKNLVFNRSILPSTGFASVSDNLGQIRNKGIEAGVNWRVFQRGTSFVSLFGKIAVNDNRVQKISDALREYNELQQKQASQSGSTAPVIQYYDGVPLNSIWANPSLGIDPVSGNEIFLDKDGNMTTTWHYSNLINCGSSDPLYNGNFGISAEIKGFGINMVCTYYGGGYLYNSTLVNKVENVYIGNNVDRRIFSDRWHYTGQEAQYRNGYYSPTRATSRFVQKNNVLSLSSFSLYYEFPSEMLRKIKMNRLRLMLYANDLHKFSSIEIERGTSYPYARTFSFSVTATF